MRPQHKRFLSAVAHPLRKVLVLALAFAFRLAALIAGPAHVRKVTCLAARPAVCMLEPALRFGMAHLAISTANGLGGDCADVHGHCLRAGVRRRKVRVHGLR